MTVVIQDLMDDECWCACKECNPMYNDSPLHCWNDKTGCRLDKLLKAVGEL